MMGNDTIRTKAAFSGGKNFMLAVTQNEPLFLIRKDNCPAGKWIVKNKNFQCECPLGLIEILGIGRAEKKCS